MNRTEESKMNLYVDAKEIMSFYPDDPDLLTRALLRRVDGQLPDDVAKILHTLVGHICSDKKWLQRRTSEIRHEMERIGEIAKMMRKCGMVRYSDGTKTFEVRE